MPNGRTGHGLRGIAVTPELFPGGGVQAECNFILALAREDDPSVVLECVYGECGEIAHA